MGSVPKSGFQYHISNPVKDNNKNISPLAKVVNKKPSSDWELTLYVQIFVANPSTMRQIQKLQAQSAKTQKVINMYVAKHVQNGKLQVLGELEQNSNLLSKKAWKQ